MAHALTLTKLPPPQCQLGGKGLDTAALAEVLAATQQQWQQQRGRRRRRRGEQMEAADQPVVTALDAGCNALDALPLGSPEASLVLHGLAELCLTRNCLQAGLGAFKSMRRLVHLGAWIVVLWIGVFGTSTHQSVSKPPSI